MFKHTVFANNFKMIIDATKIEIEKELDELYKKAKETYQKQKKMFIAIYFSGAGKQILDYNKEPVMQRQVGFCIQAAEGAEDPKWHANIEEKI